MFWNVTTTGLPSLLENRNVKSVCGSATRVVVALAVKLATYSNCTRRIGRFALDVVEYAITKTSFSVSSATSAVGFMISADGFVANNGVMIDDCCCASVVVSSIGSCSVL